MNRGAGWFRKWKRDRDPLATPQSPLTQLTDDQLAAAIAEEQRRASRQCDGRRGRAKSRAAAATKGAGRCASCKKAKAKIARLSL
jgi:hypothetical protein